MINKKQGVSALVIMALGLWASSSSHQATDSTPTHSSYGLAESAENGFQGIVEHWDFANPAATQVAAPAVVAKSQYSFVTIGSKGLPARWDPCAPQRNTSSVLLSTRCVRSEKLQACRYA